MKNQNLTKSGVSTKPVKKVENAHPIENKSIATRREVQYVQGVARQGSKRRVQELQKIYGIGKSLAVQACHGCGILMSTRAGQLNVEQVRMLEKLLEEHTLFGSDRRKREYENINRQMTRGTNRGIRIRRGLPVRGQRTKTNAYTARKLNVHRGKVKA